MPKPNKNFELDPADIELIENALTSYFNDVDEVELKRDIHNLLGRIHNQKVWYRPKKMYVGG